MRKVVAQGQAGDLRNVRVSCRAALSSFATHRSYANAPPGYCHPLLIPLKKRMPPAKPLLPLPRSPVSHDSIDPSLSRTVASYYRRIVSIMLRRIFVAIFVAAMAVILFRHAGSFLVVKDAPEHADVIVVLAGGHRDVRYWNGVRLMREGFSQKLLLDVFAKNNTFGHSDIDLAQDLLNHTTPGQSTVCPIDQDSTYDEAMYLERCLQAMGARSVLLVTTDYHSRRALSILRKRLPQYHFSNDNAHEAFFFGERWWTNREWAKTTIEEWERFIWWKLVDRWRSGTVIGPGFSLVSRY